MTTTDPALPETMPGGVMSVQVLYGCEDCRNSDLRQPPTCKINRFTSLMLVLKGRRFCPFRNKSDKQIEELLNTKTA